MNSNIKCGNLSMNAIPKVLEYNVSWSLTTCQYFLISEASWFQPGIYSFDPALAITDLTFYNSLVGISRILICYLFFASWYS